MAETEQSTARTEAIEVLAAARRRLADRLVEAVLARKDAWSKCGVGRSGPAMWSGDFSDVADALAKVEQALAALKSLSDGDLDGSARPADERAPATDEVDGTFERFASLVTDVRMEEASRELSHILHMPLDRAGTAARFFARSAKADPDVVRELPMLRRRLAALPTAGRMRLLMRIFGFQAVEAQAALRALLSGERPAQQKAACRTL